MERGSDKVSARKDDELKHELSALLQSGTHESHTEEWKQQEPAGEDQPTVDTFAGADPGVEPDVAQRLQLANYLPAGEFPMVREMVIDLAERKYAPDDVVADLRRLPAGREFHDVADLVVALNGPHASRR